MIRDDIRADKKKLIDRGQSGPDRADWKNQSLVKWWYKVSSDSLCKQLEPSSRQSKCSGSKLFDTPMVFLKEFLERVDFGKNQQMTKKCKITK